ncbi:MAG: ABC transporter ATP-binding protein [Aggregatilineales bacterium]
MHWSYSRRVHKEAVPGAPALEVRDLVVSYPGTRRLSLKGINLCVPIGTQLALVGHNGAGKSTLLKVVAGLLPIRSGSVLIYGNPPGACHHRVAYLPQRGEIDWRFPITLRELVLTGRYVHLGWFKRPTREDRRIVDAMIDQLGLSDLCDRQIGQLSGGQQQRAMLARALAQDADLLLLDEPLNAVDSETRAIIAAVLDRLKARGKTVITATHDLGRLETDFDAAFYLAEGRGIAAPPATFNGAHAKVLP